MNMKATFISVHHYLLVWEVCVFVSCWSAPTPCADCSDENILHNLKLYVRVSQDFVVSIMHILKCIIVSFTNSIIFIFFSLSLKSPIIPKEVILKLKEITFYKKLGPVLQNMLKISSFQLSVEDEIEGMGENASDNLVATSALLKLTLKKTCAWVCVLTPL